MSYSGVGLPMRWGLWREMDSYFTRKYIFEEDTNKEVIFLFSNSPPFLPDSPFSVTPGSYGTSSGKGERRGNLKPKENWEKKSQGRKVEAYKKGEDMALN